MTGTMRDDVVDRQLYDEAMARDDAAMTVLNRKPSWSTEPAGPPTTEPRSGSPLERLRHRRRLIVMGLLALVGLAVLDLLLGSLMHQQRQHHLAVSFTQPKVKLVPGDALMALQIPTIGFNEIVTEGGSSAELGAGPGHVLGTSIPGAPGNTVIVGRATRHGGPFGELDTLTKGAKIAAKTRNGLVRLYTVVSVKKVSGDDRSALRPTKDEHLTLVTSNGGIWPSSRVVVRATPTAKADATAVKIATPRYHPASDALNDSSYDLLGLAGLVLLILGVAFGRRALASRYRSTTVIAVLAPAVALAAVLLLGLVDAVGPSTW